MTLFETTLHFYKNGSGLALLAIILFILHSVSPVQPAPVYKAMPSYEECISGFVLEITLINLSFSPI